MLYVFWLQVAIPGQLLTVRAPGATFTSAQYKKELVVVMAKSEEAHKAAEDQIVSNHKKLSASYPVFTLKQLGEDTLKMKNMVKAQGYDAILTKRLILTKAKSTYIQGGLNPAYQDNFILYAPEYYKAGVYATDMDYIVASNFYSLKDEKLLWSGVTASTNPKKLDKFSNLWPKRSYIK